MICYRRETGVPIAQRFIILTDSLVKVHHWAPLKAWLAMANIVMIESPPNSTMDTNVLDSELLFGSFKKELVKAAQECGAVAEWNADMLRSILPSLCKKCFTPNRIMGAYRQRGVWPPNPVTMVHYGQSKMKGGAVSDAAWQRLENVAEEEGSFSWMDIPSLVKAKLEKNARAKRRQEPVAMLEYLHRAIMLIPKP